MPEALSRSCPHRVKFEDFFYVLNGRVRHEHLNFFQQLLENIANALGESEAHGCSASLDRLKPIYLVVRKAHEELKQIHGRVPYQCRQSEVHARMLENPLRKRPRANVCDRSR